MGCVRGQYGSTRRNPVASRSAPVKAIWSGRWKLDARDLLNGVGALLPARAWRSGPVLAVMSRVAGVPLRAGRMRLTGLTPNGQRFTANPLRMWVARSSRASIGGVDLGEMGPAPEQAHLRDFAIPQRGVFVVGRAFFAESAD
jgi:hypothetical protein